VIVNFDIHIRCCNLFYI